MAIRQLKRRAVGRAAFVRQAHEQGIWIMKDGRELAVFQMSDRQLEAVRAYLEKRLAGVTDEEERIDREPLWPHVVREYRARHLDIF